MLFYALLISINVKFMKVLMVCLGNICRSPIAQGILESKIKKYQLVGWEVDSAGTSGWHDGEAPDQRAIMTAQRNGVHIATQTSRKITKNDLDYYDLILAMDSSNYQDIIAICSTESQKNKVQLIMNYQFPDKNMAVPDPYYDNRFEEVFDLLDSATEQLIKSYITG